MPRLTPNRERDLHGFEAVGRLGRRAEQAVGRLGYGETRIVVSGTRKCSSRMQDSV